VVDVNIRFDQLQDIDQDKPLKNFDDYGEDDDDIPDYNGMEDFSNFDRSAGLHDSPD
jgi:hypothetical protein